MLSVRNKPNMLSVVMLKCRYAKCHGAAGKALQVTNAIAYSASLSAL